MIIKSWGGDRGLWGFLTKLMKVVKCSSDFSSFSLIFLLHFSIMQSSHFTWPIHILNEPKYFILLIRLQHISFLSEKTVKNIFGIISKALICTAYGCLCHKYAHLFLSKTFLSTFHGTFHRHCIWFVLGHNINSCCDTG